MRTSFLRRLHIVGIMLASFSPLAGPPVAARAAEESANVREIEIVVEGGYSPARVTVKRGERVRLRFIRKEWNGCTRELVFPALNLRRELPPGKPVVIEVPPLDPGEYEFRCGMNMIRGTLVVAAA